MTTTETDRPDLTCYQRSERFNGGIRGDRTVRVEWTDINRRGVYSDTAMQADDGNDRGYPIIELSVLENGDVFVRECHVGGSGPRLTIPRELFDLAVDYVNRTSAT